MVVDTTFNGETNMNFIDTVKLVVSFLPTIVDAINTVEKLFPEGGKGAAKLEMVKGILVAANEQAANQIENFEKFWPMISKVIAGVVAFKKK